MCGLFYGLCGSTYCGFIPIADANDEAQFGELYVQLELTERA